MKKIVGVLLLLLVLTAAYADGTVSALGGKSISITTTNSGIVTLKFTDNQVFLSPDQRNYLIGALSASNDLLGALSADNFSIKANRYLGNWSINPNDKVEFWVDVNTLDTAPYALEISFYYAPREVIQLNSQQAASFISELQKTITQTDGIKAQEAKLDALIEKVRIAIK